MGARIAAFACGIIILYSGLFTPPRALATAVAALILLAVAARARERWRTLRLTAACLLLGLAWAASFSWVQLSDRLAPGLEGEQLTVSGYLCSAGAPGAWGSVRFSLCLDHSRPTGVPARLRLSWYGDDATLNLPSPMTAVVVLKRPHGAVNPAGFRYETWLFRQGYGATGTVRSLAADPAASCGLPCRYHNWRQGLVLAAGEALEGMTHKGLALSLLLGHRGELEHEHWDVLQATGTIHLVAISGLHLGLVATLAGLLVRWLASWLPMGCATSPQSIRRWLWLLVAMAACGYALLAGFTVPTRRALVMVVIAGWLVLGGRMTSPWRGWLLALGLVLLSDPVAPLDQGFWLSFGAVAVLILVFSGRYGRPGMLSSLVLAQAAVFAGLWPVLSVLDQGAAWVGLVANVVAIPLLSLLVMPLLLMAGTLLVVSGDALAGTVSVVLDLTLGCLWWVLSNLASLELPAGRMPVGLAFAFAVVVLLALWIPDRRLRVASMAVAGMVLLAGAVASGNRWQTAPRIWVWDVGQGLSVLVQHRDQTLIYDTGPESASGYNAVSEVLIPSFDRLGIRTIDTLVLSHGDQDHAGGLDALLERYSPGRIIAGEPSRLAAGQPVTACTEQEPLRIGELEASFWQAKAGERSTEANDRSCVLILEYGGQLLLLPGDISRRTEQQLLADRPELARRQGELTLVAPHHGSKTSSGGGFVRALAPERVIFTAGYRHRYGHPHPDVVSRYHQAGSEAFNTATSGALRLDLLPQRVRVSRWREGAAFWIRGPEPAVSPD